MNSKAFFLALAVAGAVCGPAWGQDHGGNPYAPKSSTNARGNAANVTNPYELTDPYASKSSTNAYGNPASVDRSTSPYDAVDPYNPYASKSSTDVYGNPSSVDRSTSPYDVVDPYNPYASKSSTDVYGNPSSMSGSTYGAGDPYGPTPPSDANQSAGGHYGENPAGRGPRNDGLSNEDPYDSLNDKSLYDPLTVKRTGLSAGSGLAADPYGLSPYPAAKPKVRQLDDVSSGISGFDPFDAKSVLAPPLGRSLLPATASGGGAKRNRFALPNAILSGQGNPLLPPVVPGGAAQ